MTEERGETHQPAVGIDALSIPAKQRGHCERVPQIMESRGRHAWRNMQLQFGHESMEGHADARRAHGTPFRIGEQR